MSNKSQAEDRVGAFFLAVVDGYWKIKWYDEASGQTKKLSTKEPFGQLDDEAHERARLKLAEHAVAFTKRTQAQQDAPLKEIFANYRLKRAGTIRSSSVFSRASARMMDFFGPNCLSADITTDEQERWIAELRNPKQKGETAWADSTIHRAFNAIWAAFNKAENGKLILRAPPRVSNDDWKPYMPNNERTYSLDEVAALLNVAGSQGTPNNKGHRFSREHWWRYCIIAIGTGARPEAILDLHSDQVDFRNGTISLNPEGRVQNKKRRNKIPMAPTLAKWLHAWGPGTYVTYYGKPLASVRQFWDNMRKAAGDDTMTSYVMRHTLATWFEEDDEINVPERQIDYLMGWVGEGSKTSRRYKHPSAKRMPQIVASIEKLYRELAMLVRVRDLLEPAESDYADPLVVTRLANVRRRRWEERYSVRVLGEAKLERETGLEPATCSLATNCSTTELFPLPAERAGNVPEFDSNLLILKGNQLARTTLARGDASRSVIPLRSRKGPKSARE